MDTWALGSRRARECISPPCGNNVLIKGDERAIKRSVTGTRSIAVYLAAEEKTLFTNSESFSGSNLENTGKRDVETGIEMNVRSVAK